MSDEENVYKFFNYVPESINLPKPSVEKNVTATKIDSVTKGVEFVPYWRTVLNKNGITLIVNDAIRLAVMYFNKKQTANRANTWYNWGLGQLIPSNYRPVRQFIQPAHLYFKQVKIVPSGVIYFSSEVEGTATYTTSIVYPYFSNREEPPDPDTN